VVVDLGGQSIPFASVEDLIILKLIAGRPVDLQDAATVVRRKGASVDWSFIAEWIRRFAQIEGFEDLEDRLRLLHHE
jgi:predicted nucleotidyltransferase